MTPIFEILLNIILILGIFIHNEIIIINKWGFNEYTKKKIRIKSEEDVKIAELYDNEINNSDLDESDLKENIQTELEE